MDDHGLTQYISEITRIDPVHGTENTLGLILTNRPHAVQASCVIPGISDHDASQLDFVIKPVRVVKKPREIPMYKKTQWDKIHEHVHRSCGPSGLQDLHDGGSCVDP